MDGWRKKQVVDRAAFGRKIERQNASTSLNTAEPDWKSIADELYAGICRAVAKPDGDTRLLVELATKYEAASR